MKNLSLTPSGVMFLGLVLVLLLAAWLWTINPVFSMLVLWFGGAFGLFVIAIFLFAYACKELAALLRN